MPLITIKSLPFNRPLDFSEITSQISVDIAEGVGRSVGCINVVWELIPSGHHAAGGRAVPYQTETTPPLIVQLLGTADYTSKTIEKYYRVIAESISARTGVHRTNIFIYFSTTEGGRIHEGG